jgi:hypothetical protein
MSTARFTRVLTLRVTSDLGRRLESEAALGGVAPNQTARALIEEGLRSREFPGIVFRGGPAGRRAAIEGRLDVWEIVATWKDWAGDVGAARTQLGLRPDQINLALAYYRRYADEIDSWIRRNEEEADRLMSAARGQPAG